MINICKTCGQEFAFPNPRQYCSHHCQVLSLKEINHGSKELVCTICGKTFSVSKTQEKKNFVCKECREVLDKQKREISETICEVCGKSFSYDWRRDKSTRKKKPLKFCSRSCANTKEYSLESREKVSRTLRERNVTDPNFYEKKLEQVRKSFKTKYGEDYEIHEPKACSICGKKISWESKTGLCKNCLNHSPEGKEILSANGKRLMMEGKIKPWMSQAEISYPEKFWIKVLNNNFIPFESQVKEYPYRLDFLIEKNGIKLDLEIDGGQHQLLENKIHDEERDSLLRSRGFQVYRIPWNEINSEKGSQLMKEKIDSFLEMFYNL